MPDSSGTSPAMTVASTHGRSVHKRIPGRTMNDHVEAITQYRAAVADLL